LYRQQKIKFGMKTILLCFAFLGVFLKASAQPAISGFNRNLESNKLPYPSQVEREYHIPAAGESQVAESVWVSDIQGRTYGPFTAQPDAQRQEWVVDLSSLQPGLYHIREIGKTRRVKKIIWFSKR
jgi:hypothetical protein